MSDCSCVVLLFWFQLKGSDSITQPTYTAISREVVGKNVHATTPKGNMGYDQYTVPNDCTC